MSKLLDTIFSNNLNLTKMNLLNDFFKKTFNAEIEPKKEDKELDLHEMAIKSHNRNFLTFEYDFLHMTPENEKTYELGFMAGVMYATGEQLKLINKQELERNPDPSLNRQNETL